MNKYLMCSIFTDGHEMYSFFEAASSSEAKRRAYLRLAAANMIRVSLWIKNGADWKFLHTFSVE